jgi:hypothetical protein
MLKVSMVREAELFFPGGAEERSQHRKLSRLGLHDTERPSRENTTESLAWMAGPSARRACHRKVHRGGLLTMAAVLKVTANGTTTSPVKRGVWVLERILGTPTKPPPRDVGSVEPDTRGSSTIREQLAKHRRLESCASCHVTIDPPGSALESFDVIGGWRERYRATGNGVPVVKNGRRWLISMVPRSIPATSSQMDERLPTSMNSRAAAGTEGTLCTHPRDEARHVRHRRRPDSRRRRTNCIHRR